MNLRGKLRQSVSRRPKTGENDWGTPSYGAPQTLPARVDGSQRRLTAPDGSEIVSQAEVMLVDYVELGDELSYTLTLPGGQVITESGTVQRRDPIVDLGGNTIGYTCYL